MDKKVLYPPLETDSDKTHERTMSLSYDLTSSFNTVSEIHLAQKRMESHEQNLSNGLESSKDKDILQKRKYEAAISAAVAAESAIAALSNGITELENLLLEEDAMGKKMSTNGLKSSTRGT